MNRLTRSFLTVLSAAALGCGSSTEAPATVADTGAPADTGADGVPDTGPAEDLGGGSDAAADIAQDANEPSDSSGAAPVVADLTFSPTTTLLGESVDVKGTVRITDADGDLSHWFVRFVRPDGTEEMPLQGGFPQSKRDAQLSWSRNLVAPDQLGDYRVELWADDLAGNVSAVVSGIVTVTDEAPPSPVPELEQLNFFPNTAKAGVEIHYAGSVVVRDNDGDLETFYARFRLPDGSASETFTYPVTGLPNPKAGVIDIDVLYTAPVAGDYAVELWVDDAAGNQSNTVGEAIVIEENNVFVNTPPTAANLVFTPTSVTHGKDFFLEVSFDAADVDGNLRGFAMDVLRPDGTKLTPPWTALVPGGNLTDSTVTFKRYLEPDVAGDYTISITVDDKELAKSNVVSGTLTIVAVPDSPPVATKLEHAPSTAKTGLTVNYHGRVGFTDINGDPKELRMRMRLPDGTTTADTVFPVTGIANLTAANILYDLDYKADTAGVYTLEGRVVDKSGNESNVVSGTITLTAPPQPVNAGPTATDLFVTPESASTGQSVAISGTFLASDEDGDLRIRHARIRRPDDTTTTTATSVISGPSGQLSATVTFTLWLTAAVPGTYEVEAWVTDSTDTASNVVTWPLIVTDPALSAPVAANLTVTPSTANTGVATSLSGSADASDLEGDVNSLLVRIRRPDGVLTAPVTTPVTGVGTHGYALNYQPPLAGSYAVEAWFSDAAGNTSNTVSASFTVTSVPKAQNSVPLATNLVFSPATAAKGLAATFSGTFDASDVDADLATMHLRFKKPGGTGLTEVSAPIGLADGSGGQVGFNLPLTPDTTGNWTLEAYAKDSKGAKSTTLSGTFVVSNPPSTVPVATSVTVTPGTAEAGAPVTYSGELAFTDLDGDPTTLHLRFKRPGGTVSAETAIPVGLLADPTAGTIAYSLTYTPTVAGTYTLEAWVKDTLGQKSNTVTAATTASAPAQAPNTAPSVEALVFSPTAAEQGKAITVTGSFVASDIDKNWATARYRFRRPNGSALPEASVSITATLTGKDSGEITFSRALTPDAAGTWAFEVKLVDAAGALSNTASGELVVSAVAVPSDTAPELVRLSAQPLSLLIDQAKTLSGLIELRDLDGDHEAVRLSLRTPAGELHTETFVPLADFDGDVNVEVSFTLDVTLTEVGEHTLEAQAIDLEGQESNVLALTVVGTDLSNVNSACAATELDCTGEGFCYDVNSTTCEYLDGKQVTLDACDEVGSTGSVAACVSSIEDTSSPYAFTDSNCSFVQFWSNPTVFPIDCRCPDAGFEAPCRRPYELPSTITFGEGPRPRNLATEMRLWNGPILGREWFVPAFWKTASKPNQTMIYAIHLDTGARRYFSGTYNDPANGLTRVAEGPDFVQVMDMDVGPDGQFYAVGASSEIAHPKIWRVDPTNGNRTLIFDAATAPASALCPNGSTLPGLKTVQMAAQGWAIDSQGRFYFSMVNQPGPSIVRIAADGQTCDYLTSIVDIPSNSRSNVGGGYDDIQHDFRAFHIKDGKLYTVSGYLFVEVDLATGSRKLLSKATDLGNIGTGPINAEGLGDKWTRWDPYRNIFWTVGALGGSSAVAVDPASGNRFTWPCWHPKLGGPMPACGGTGKALIPGYLNFGGFAIDPEGDHALYFAHDLFAIVKYDPKTGNAYTFSL